MRLWSKFRVSSQERARVDLDRTGRGQGRVEFGQRLQEDPRVASEVGTDFFQNLGPGGRLAGEIPVELGAVDVERAADGRDRWLGGHQLPEVLGEDLGGLVGTGRPGPFCRTLQHRIHDHTTKARHFTQT